MVTIADRNVFPRRGRNLSAWPVRYCARRSSGPPGMSSAGTGWIACIDADDGLSDDDILKHCRARLGPLKAPRLICRPAQFPVLASGKPDLRALEAVLSGGAP